MGLGSWCYSVFALTFNVGNSKNLKNQKFITVEKHSAKRYNPLLDIRRLTEKSDFSLLILEIHECPTRT